jgi:tetratricopeptide (TPR) repeat protein
MTPAGRKRLRWAGLVLLLLGGLGAVAIVARARRPGPPPPVVDLGGADPAVAAAIEKARAGVEQGPNDAQAWGFLGMVLHAHEHVAEAAECFRQARRLDAREPRWAYYLGVSLALTDLEAALPCLREAVELWGEGEVAPRLRLAELLLAQGRDDEAEGLFRGVLRQAPHSALAHLGLARLAAQKNDSALALKHLEKCLADPDAQKPARALRAELFHRRGEGAAAERERRLVRSLPDPGSPFDPHLQEMADLQVGRVAAVARARRLFRQGQPGQAIALLQETVRAYPEAGSVWLDLGRAYLDLNDPRQAEPALRAALAREPGRVESSYYLGLALAGQGRIDEAAGHFRQAVRLRPDFVEAHLNLGKCLKHQGKRAEAIAQFRTALRYRPQEATAHVLLGEQLKQEGRTAEAREHLQRAASLDPDNAQARKLLESLPR